MPPVSERKHGVVQALAVSKRGEYKEPMIPLETISSKRLKDNLGPGIPGGLELVGLYRPRGECSLAEVAELARGAVEYCRHRGVTRLLINVTGLTGFAIPSLVDRFILAEEWAKAAEHMVAVALVVSEGYIHPEKFGVAVAAHFGFRLDVFSSETDALTWISSLAHPR
jgi:hypothetical protein